MSCCREKAAVRRFEKVGDLPFPPLPLLEVEWTKWKIALQQRVYRERVGEKEREGEKEAVGACRGVQGL